MSDELKKSMQTIKEQIQNLKQVLQKESRTLLEQGSLELFIQYPNMYSFGWRQFTDYFNDGEPTSFSVYSDEPSVNEHSGWDVPAEMEDAQKAVSSFIQSFDEDILKTIFGDHKEIEITKEGITITEYDDHD